MATASWPNKSAPKLVNFTLRLPPELRKELDIAAEFEHAKDPTELVRGWIRYDLAKLNNNGTYQKFKAAKLTAEVKWPSNQEKQET